MVRTRGSRRHRLAGVDHSRPGRLGGRVRRRRPAHPGPVSPGNLPPGYSIPATATDAEWVALTFALAPLGKPDVFDRRPDTHDCPWPPGPPLAYAAHFTVTRWQEGTPAPDDSLLWPGDRILIPGRARQPQPAHPTARRQVHRPRLPYRGPHTRDIVKIVRYRTFGRSSACATSPNSRYDNGARRWAHVT